MNTQNHLLDRPTRIAIAVAVAALLAAAWLGASRTSHDKLVAATAVQPARTVTYVTLPRVEVTGYRDRQVAGGAAQAGRESL
jgi:hypothetical protein